MTSGLSAWRHLASHDEKYAYGYLNMSHGLTNRHDLTKHLPDDVVIHYALSELTKRYSLVVVLMFPYF